MKGVIVSRPHEAAAKQFGAALWDGRTGEMNAAEVSFELSKSAPEALQLLALEGRLQRERHARLTAEAVAEKGLRDLYERQAQLELLASIAAAANASATPEPALEHALRAICDHTGWEVGHVFVLNQAEEPRLASARVAFARSTLAVQPFIDASFASEFVQGQGLPGRVWAHGTPVWIDDVILDANFPRLAIADACGLHAAFAFPLMVGDDVRGVMEFFHASPLSADAALLTLSAQIGTQLGRALERAGSQRKLQHEAAHDGLTGLPNRSAFTDAVDAALAQGRPICVLAIDLDGFKPVNDTLGHSMGDVLLRQVAERLRALPGAGFVARLGGDEFAMLVRHEGDGVGAETLAADVIQRLAEPFTLPAGQVSVGASVGVAHGPDHGAGVEALLAAADLALYRAKAEGRRCARTFEPKMRTVALLRRAQEDELRKATLLDQFELHYQPQVRTADEALVGAEALLRWRHPERGLQSPAEFLPTLETSTLAGRVGAWVIDTSCRQAAEWRGRGAPNLRLGVNLFGAQLRSADLVRTVGSALERSGLPPEALEIEITENIALHHDDDVVDHLKRLRDLGVGIAFDDYGTGYASFSLLKRYPLTRLKIDQSFVRSMCEDPRDMAVVCSVLELGRAFRLGVIAEGVEREQQRAQLDLMGCEELQGYLFDKPLSGPAFSEKHFPC